MKKYTLVEKCKIRILRFFMFFHLVHIMVRLNKGAHDVWNDKPNWMIQVTAFRLTENDFAGEEDDSEKMSMMYAITNTACIELKKRNLKSFDLFA